MNTYLARAMDAIRIGKSLDWPTTRKHLLRMGVHEALMDKAVQATRYSDKSYQVVIVDSEAFTELCKYAGPVDKSSRSAASTSGNTHATNVDGALLVASDATSPVPYNYVLRHSSSPPTPPKRHAMLIENLECFLDFKAVYQFAVQKCGITYPEDEIEFIWAAGNGISNKLIIPYLKLFTGRVLCVFDMDFGGLKIYANLLSGGLDHENTIYLTPNDLAERLKISRRKASSKELDALSQVYGLSPQTDQIISALRHYRTKVEQESYRAPR